MDFTDAVVFVAAIIVVIAAGALLGSILRGRAQRRLDDKLQERKFSLYSDLVGMLDSIAGSSEMQKQRFIYKYYEVLMFAPDEVVHKINTYLDSVTAIGADLSPERIMELRGETVLAMRRDIAKSIRANTRLKKEDLYKIEIGESIEEPKKSRSKRETEAANK